MHTEVTSTHVLRPKSQADGLLSRLSEMERALAAVRNKNRLLTDRLEQAESLLARLTDATDRKASAETEKKLVKTVELLDAKITETEQRLELLTETNRKQTEAALGEQLNERLPALEMRISKRLSALDMAVDALDKDTAFDINGLLESAEFALKEQQIIAAAISQNAQPEHESPSVSEERISEMLTAQQSETLRKALSESLAAVANATKHTEAALSAQILSARASAERSAQGAASNALDTALRAIEETRSSFQTEIKAVVDFVEKRVGETLESLADRPALPKALSAVESELKQKIDAIEAAAEKTMLEANAKLLARMEEMFTAQNETKEQACNQKLASRWAEMKDYVEFRLIEAFGHTGEHASRINPVDPFTGFGRSRR